MRLRGPVAALASSAAPHKNAPGGGDVTRQVITIKGNSTEIWDMPSSGPPKLQVLVVPGNPGNAGYYRTFIREIHTQLGGKARVTGISHLGHSTCDLGGRLFSLEDQIEHKVDLLREKLMGPDHPPIAILGHSIGAYIATHATARVDKGLGAAQPGSAPPGSKRTSADTPAGTARSPIRKMVGLFPFMCTDFGQPTQRRLRFLTRLHEPLSHIVGAIGFLPLPLKRRIVNMIDPGLNHDAAELTASILSRPLFNNAFYMAKTEFEDLNRPHCPEWPLVSELGGRVAMVGTSDDAWCQPWKWQEMKQALPPQADLLWDDTQVHGFCVSDELSVSLAKRVAGVLHPLVEDAGGHEGETQGGTKRPRTGGEEGQGKAASTRAGGKAKRATSKAR